jgi:hypothetical protein
MKGANDRFADFKKCCDQTAAAAFKAPNKLLFSQLSKIEQLNNNIIYGF